MSSRKGYNELQKMLIWYFNHSESAVGYKSNFSGMISGTWGKNSNIIVDPYSDGIVKQTTRHRTIRNALYAIPVDDRRLLEACFDERYRYPAEIASIFGTKTGAVLFTTIVPTLDELQKLCKRKKQKRETEQDQKNLFLIRKQAIVLLNRALALLATQLRWS